MEQKLETVSIVIPIYNEEKYIENFIKSLLNQDYDFNKIEIVFIDGNSTDNTKKIIENTIKKENVDMKVLDNIDRITPKSLNIGIKVSKNDIIIRLDAHSEYPQNYISKCVYYINNVAADNVGCTIETKSEGIIGKAIENVLSSKFGVGNSGFRTNAKSGYTDTVPFGTFRRSLFDKIGYFDERLARNQDSEFNSRIIKNGGKIYLFNDISIIYHPRNTIRGLIKMAMLNGKWNLYTNYLVPGSMKIRHFIPFIYFISIIIGILSIIFKMEVIKYMFYLEMILYLFLDIFFSFKNIKKGKLLNSFLCLILYPLFHISYGIGTFRGIFFTLRNRGRK